MLGLTRKTDYALLVVAAFASRPRVFVSTRALAADYRLPYRFAAHIVGLLARAGILESREGTRGGYRLARDPAAITVRDILRVTEGDLALVSCLNAAQHFACPQKSWCQAQTGISIIQRRFLQSLGEMTIADVLRESAHATR